jgi:hypothetical protein
MDSGFRELMEGLHPKFERLVSMPPARYSDLPRLVPERGIYLFSEGEQHLYVGRTNGIKKRLQNHCRPSGTHFSATFAFRVARVETGMIRASYTKTGSRDALLQDPAFATAFTAAKTRVAAMDIRFVEEADSVRQALLEIYAATVLRTPYNDFDNH